MTIRVVVADDQPLVVAGLQMLLGTEPDISVVASVGDGEQAVAAVLEHRPDVVVMDVRMPRLDGVEATRRITALTPPPGPYDAAAGDAPYEPPGVLMLTTYDADAAVYGALNAGARGFLLKDVAPQELVLAVRAVAGGGGWLAPDVTRRLIDQFAGRPLATARRDPRLDLLTARELDVLTHIGHGRSNAEIAVELVVSEGTVKTHVSHLLTKLDLRDRAQAAVFAYAAHVVQA